MTNNPLLTVSHLPNFAPPFAQIKTEHYVPALKESVKMAKTNIDMIKNSGAPADFENTIVALEVASQTMEQVIGVYYNQLSCVGGDDLQNLAGEIGPVSSNFSSDVILDADLFARVKAVYDARDTLTLSIEQRTLLEETYKGFVRGGALLDKNKKQRLREISERLSVLGPNFMNNVSKSSEAFEMIIEDEADLSGLPDNARVASRMAAQEKGHSGKWLFTLDAPSIMPFLQFSDKRALREKIWRAFSARAYGDAWDNCDNIKEIIALKYERANLLGYKTHADYVLEKRMAEKPEAVFAFLEKLKSVYKPAAEKDLQALKDLAFETHRIDDLKPWDVSYYAEKLKQKLFSFSSEDLRPYFPLAKVLDGCFTHFSKLFDLKFTAAQGYETWHKDVQVFEVTDVQSGAFIGTLFADFYPREGKKPGAWMTNYRQQGLYNGKVERPVVAIVCNFTKPTQDKPSLLTHDEVTTLFHEMGHAVHGLLSDVTYPSLSGTNVLWDFVELPSQVQENWCYEKETLDMFAGHYETGAKIPADLIEKLRAAMNYMVAWGGLRQVTFAQMDMQFHTEHPETIVDITAFEEKATADVRLFPREGGSMATSFLHIFGGGYSAGYYSYKWAKVLDADTFELFLEHGLYDAKTAASYKKEILMRGGSQHPRILYHNFRGRDADPEAMFRSEGLLNEKAA